MKRLLGLLLVMGMVGCGGPLEKLGAYIERNEQGEVVKVSFRYRKIPDTGLVHLKELANLHVLDLTGTQITDAGLVHLKGLTNLQELYLGNTKVTDASVAELKQAFPNCKINH